MSLVGKTIRLAESTLLAEYSRIFEDDGLDFLVVDKLNATHHGNAGDDEYLIESIKSGRLKMILPVYLINAKILPTGEQA